MGIYRLFESMTQYISEAAVRIFSPNDDAYPVIGVQPFTGEPFHGNRRSDWQPLTRILSTSSHRLRFAPVGGDQVIFFTDFGWNLKGELLRSRIKITPMFITIGSQSLVISQRVASLVSRPAGAEITHPWNSPSLPLSPSKALFTLWETFAAKVQGLADSRDVRSTHLKWRPAFWTTPKQHIRDSR